jgi:hypothetical protein
MMMFHISFDNMMTTIFPPSPTYLLGSIAHFCTYYLTSWEEEKVYREHVLLPLPSRIEFGGNTRRLTEKRAKI